MSENLNDTFHKCDMPDSSENYQGGPAISYCVEYDDFKLFAGNGEYESQVNFCPICGYEAKIKIEEVSKEQLEKAFEKVESHDIKVTTVYKLE